MREVLIPAEFDDVYLRYNEVQIAQGMDLRPFAGRTCSQWGVPRHEPPLRQGGARLPARARRAHRGRRPEHRGAGRVHSRALRGFSGEGGEQAQTASEPAQSAEPAPGELPAQTASESAQSTEPAEAASEQEQSAA